MISPPEPKSNLVAVADPPEAQTLPDHISIISGYSANSTISSGSRKTDSETEAIQNPHNDFSSI
jgi:hypothetical protein